MAWDADREEPLRNDDPFLRGSFFTELFFQFTFCLGDKGCRFDDEPFMDGFPDETCVWPCPVNTRRKI